MIIAPLFLQRAKAGLQDLAVGQPVISKHKNGRFYQCEVINLTKETFYEVNFDDGSFSDNLYPEDIVVCFAVKKLLHQKIYSPKKHKVSDC